MPTNFENKAGILGDLWINFRTEEQFKDFIEYNDIGLPLAYFVSSGVAIVEDQGKTYIEETFNLLCAALDLDIDGEYQTLNEMFEISNQKG
jgi:hypothetical protein